MLRWRINRPAVHDTGGVAVPRREAHRGACGADCAAAQINPPTDQEPWTRRWVLVPQGIDPAPYVAAADRIAAGTLTVFSVSCANGGSPPRWNCDPKTGAEAPLTPGKLLDYRDRRLVGDIKIPLGGEPPSAARDPGTGLRTYPRGEVSSGSAAAPGELDPRLSLRPGSELVQRARSGDQTDQLVHRLAARRGATAPFFAGIEGERFKRCWLDSVYQHARFVHGYFSRHSSANNHLIGEAAGLYIAGLTWPCCVQAARVAPRGAADP